MKARAPAVKRLHQPLSPIRGALVVTNDIITDIPADLVTAETVGLKAFGLASLPAPWTLPFFVIPHGSIPAKAALLEAMTRLGISPAKRIIIRSSGVDESMDRRGALESVECHASEICSEIARLNKLFGVAQPSPNAPIHWVIQELILVVAKGHLSNERRIAEDKRDWVVEAEALDRHSAETRPISLRTWRDNRPASEEPLICRYRQNYARSLGVVARWAYDRLLRLHFEWVWDGRNIFIVQADRCLDQPTGVEPESLVQAPQKKSVSMEKLCLFREVTETDFKSYRKLANARLYRELGYEMGPFYILDNQNEIAKLIKDGDCSDELLADLSILVKRPLVLRSDGKAVPDDLKQMLPRSEELRSVQAAKLWLLESYRAAARSRSASGQSLENCEPCLIAHHFVPAMAAAWCHAKPDHRRVRIESLWGLPEGLYWHAYDAYDVDTLTPSVDSSLAPKEMKIRERRRFKEHFIAPDISGNWILHKTAAGPDWQRSIKKTAWIQEIAWTSRRIAAAAGYPVVVMWFVDVHRGASRHRVLPWYHEEWKGDGSPHKAAPRRKLSASTDFILTNRADWEELKTKISKGDSIVRVRVQPNDPNIVRDRAFAEELAAFSKSHHLVVELEGGILSHAYYMLSRAGCIVECADLDDLATEDFELEFNKLVRDDIPANIAARGEAVSALKLEGAALIAALRRKLVEESLEVLDAPTNDEIADEIADVREVLLSIMERLGISEGDVEFRRKRKLKSRGGFSEALMLTKTAISPSISFSEMQLGSGSNVISGTIHREAEIPQAATDMHVDKRLDSAGVVERQFTVGLPVYANGFDRARVSFDLPTQDGHDHAMVFELILGREGSDLRVRARIQNAAVQLHLDLDPNMSLDQSSPSKRS